jgi:hypothetical protein
MAILGVAVLLWQHRRHLDAERMHRARVGLGVAVAVLTVGGAWPLSVQFLSSDAVHDPVQNLSSYAADVFGAVVPSAFQLLGTSATSGWGGNASENGSYLGIPLLAGLAFLAWRYRREGVVRFAAALGVVAWVLSLGERLHIAGSSYDVPLPFAAVLHIPVLNSLAAVRFSLYVVLCACLVLAVGLDRLHASGAFDRQVNRRRAAVAVVLCAAPLLPKVPYSYVEARTPAYFTSSAVERIPSGAVALTYPLARFPNSAPMDWQAQSHFRYRTLGGYVITTKEHGKGTFTGGQSIWEVVAGQAAGAPSPTVATQVQRRLLQEMTELHVRAVLVADGPGATGVNQLVSILLGRGPDEHVGGVSAWYIANGPAAGPLPG